jgi:uncharacterized protein (DUF1697 family)
MAKAEMTTHIALLRGINVGGKVKIAMADLRAMLAELKFGDPRSLLNSGNLVFRSDELRGADLERLLEAETATRLGLKTDFFVRAPEEWREVIAGNPFPEEAERDPGHLVVMFLKRAPEAADVEALQAAIVGREVVRAVGRQAYLIYPDGIGDSRLTINVIEKKLGSRSTGRNWNTVLKLAALAGA